MIVHNVTSQKQLEESLEKARNAAEQANAAKTQLLANITHEIRTPLQSILGFNEVLLKKEDDEEKKRILQIINNSGSNLIQLINRILNVSGLELGSKKIQAVRFDIRKMMDDLIRSFELFAKKKNIELHFENQVPDIHYIKGDKLLLNQILINLLTNAIKYTNKGSVGLIVQEKDRHVGSCQLLFTIWDTGVGIPESKKKIIFDKYSRLENSLTIDSEGNGLGLSIVSEMVKRMKGNLDIESAEGKGTRFYISFPFELLSDNPAESPEMNVDLHASEEKSVLKARVLLAEDNPVNQELVKTLFRLKPWTLDVVDNGQKAVDKALETDYDLILMDIQMPVMNGIEASKIIYENSQKDGKSIAVIGLTAYSLNKEKKKELQAYMETIIEKPFTREQLFTTVESLLEKRNKYRFTE